MQRRTSQLHNNHDTPQVPNFVRLTGSQNNRQTQSQSRPSTARQQKNQTTEIRENRMQKPLTNATAKHSHGTLNKGFDLLRMFNFQNFKLDSDITIIIVLILLISSEETDELLLLALAYIML